MGIPVSCVALIIHIKTLSRRVCEAAPFTSKLESNARKVDDEEASADITRKKKRLEVIRFRLPAIAVAWNQH
jgi:hypothetical protein